MASLSKDGHRAKEKPAEAGIMALLRSCLVCFEQPHYVGFQSVLELAFAVSLEVLGSVLEVEVRFLLPKSTLVVL